MSIRILDELLIQSDHKWPMEDALGHEGCVAVVADGLRSKVSDGDEYKFLGGHESGDSDVGHIARRLVALLVERQDEWKPGAPHAYVNAVRRQIQQEFNKAACAEPSMVCEYPMASLAVVKAHEEQNVVEILNLGDTEIVVALNNGLIHLDSDQEHKKLENIREEEKNRVIREYGLAFPHEARPFILPMMQGHYNDHMNVNSGFSMFSTVRDVPSNLGTCIVVPRDHVRCILMGTDSFMDHYNAVSHGRRFIPDNKTLSEMDQETLACARNGGLSIQGFKVSLGDRAALKLA